jgi:acetyl-CoA carboxylase biotin carboxyl carrier protein
MSTHERDGRTMQPRRTAGLGQADDDQVLLSPGVGLVRGLPVAGSWITEGTVIGELDVLGVLHVVVAPAGAAGVVAPAERVGERPVGHGDVLVRLKSAELGGLGDAAGRTGATGAATGTAGALLFRSPLSGRFYARPSPDRPDFVKPGDEITTGQTVALLEVMKTFNRLAYGGADLPERARVRAVLVRDEADVEAGTPILELEAV